MSHAQGRQLTYGTRIIPYTLRYEPRKTLGVTVHPDLSVVVQAPPGTPQADVESVLQRRARWIAKRLDDYARYSPDLPPREYVSGETHRYLGRQYRLRVMDGEPESVSLDGQFILVSVRDRAKGRVETLVKRWYRARAREVFSERLAACYPRIEQLGVALPALAVRKMRTRWGSASPSGRISLNVKLVQVSTLLIDYVVLHELCHLVEPHHGKGYYELLSRVLPDWRQRRERLNSFELA
jgi:hypothetical protein